MLNKTRTALALQDMQSFIIYVMQNPRQFGATDKLVSITILETLVHDIQGVVNETEGFEPRTSGYTSQLAIDSK